jgi:endonuclease III
VRGVTTTNERTKRAKKAAGARAKGATTPATKRGGVKKATTAKPAAKTKARASSATPKAAASKPARRRKKPMAPPLETLAKLREIHPDAHCELDHKGPFQLLIATVLSAQTTDVNVNKATPKLFERFPDARTLGAMDPKDVEPYVSTLGFFRQKAKSIVGLSKKLTEDHGGEVPRTLDELVKLPGVGRKTANVVLGVIWNTPEGVVVDTHVQRIAQRLGWTENTEAAKIEQDLMHLIPRDQWDMTSHLLIFHGRRICFARKPNCEGCGLNTLCPSAFEAENVGRKPKRDRNAWVKAKSA